MHYIHNTPGRLRVKALNLKRNHRAAEFFERHLQGLDGVRRVAANPVVGSLTVHYDPDALRPEELIEHLKEKGLLAAEAALPVQDPRREALDRATTKLAETVGQALLEKLMEKVLERAAVTLIAAVV